MLCIALVIISGTGCKKKDQSLTTAIEQSDTLLSFVKRTEIKTKLDQYWQLDYIKEWYHTRITPPPVNTSKDLTKLSFQELWFLKNEVLAKNGYLFMDPVLRAHFNRFKWYQPIFDVKDFVLEVNSDEYDFLKRIIAEEKSRLGSLITTNSKYRLINTSMIVNYDQFKYVPENIMANLNNKNFVITAANHDQLFTVYETNTYDYTPSFITTDLYFQVLQKHIAMIMKNMEKEKLVDMLNQMLNELYLTSQNMADNYALGTIKENLEWSATYYGIALALLNEKDYPVPARFQSEYREELDKCRFSVGNNSPFLNSKLAEYSQFTVRGNYTGDPVLEKYFKCMKWLNSAKIVIPEASALAKPVCLAYVLNASQNASILFQKISNVVQFLAGDENNISVTQLSKILNSNYHGQKLEQIVKPENLSVLYHHLQANDPRKFQVPTGTKFAKEEFSKMTVLFTAGRYTLDNEIFSKLVQIAEPKHRRTSPRALDVFAALGNHMADSILHYVYNEPKQWPKYDDSLNMLKAKFKSKDDWDNNIFSKTLQTTISLNHTEENYPLFMLTPFWEKKNLNTALGGYTQLRHDFTLYIEELMAAECGGGDEGPPPAIHLSYVEPNMSFWDRSAELLQLVENKLAQNNLLTDKTKDINNQLLNLNKFLRYISEKELSGKRVTDSEFEELSAIGGRIETLTIDILGGDHLPDRDKELSIIMNVYGYRDSTNTAIILNEALGKVDEIYVVTLINGLPYITKGAVWSHYEFLSGRAMTDDEWKDLINNGSTPPTANWMNDIKIKAPSLETRPENRYY